MKRIALSCAVVVAGSLAVWAAFPVVYVSQYKDADGNPYYEGAPEGAAVYDNLQAAYNNVAAKGTIWMENDFVCNSGTVECHGNNRLSISKVVTIRSRSGDWRTGAEIHGAYHDESNPKSIGRNNCRCLAINHGGAVTCIGIRLVHGSVGSTSGDDRNGGAVKVCGLAASYFGGPSRFENCLFADCIGGCVHGMEGLDLSFDGCVMTNNVMAGGASTTGVYLSGDMSNCTAEGNVGGPCCYFAKGSVISNCHFVANTSDQAHAATCSGNQLEFYDCEFVRNAGTHGLNSYGVFGSGSGVVTGRFERCDFIANEATGPSVASGALTMFDCNIISNKNPKNAKGAIVGAVMSNCTFFANSSTSGGPGAVENSKLVDCHLIENTSSSGCGGALNCVLTDCHLIGNRITNTSGAVNGGAAKDSILTNCVVAGNSIDSSSGRGGGLYNCVACKCVITNNSVKYQGGGVYKGTCTDCLVAGNFSGQYRDGRCNNAGGWGAGCYNAHLYSCVVSNNVGTYRGGGIFNDGVAYTNMNCQIVDNVLCGTNDLQSVNFGGAAGVWQGTYFNCLIARNVDCHVAYGRAVHNPYLYNCTVTDNTSCKKNGYAGGPGIRAVNSIIAGNTVTGGGTVNKDGYTYATNSYVAVTIEEAKGKDNIVGDDPKLGTVEGFAYTPLGASPCKNRGIEFSWMRDANDIRSKDIYGHDRIMGSAPDIGAVERKGYGIMLMVR